MLRFFKLICMKKMLLLLLLLFCSCKHKKYPVVEQKSIVVVIPSYNNSRFCEQNVLSVLNQNYKNFRIIYIDDCSTDDTYEKVKDKVSVLRNKKNVGALANLYNAVHSCKDTDIIVTVDGDDFLAHSDVLKTINKAYADPNVWMTYGNYLDYPSYEQNPKICEKLPSNRNIREGRWVTSHLRTFYAGLFKRIKLEDLCLDGNFLPMAGDLAHLMPMLEMAQGHVQFIDKVLYLYNRMNPLNDHKKSLQLQANCEHFVRTQPKYEKIKEWNSAEDSQTGLIVFSYNRPMQLYALLESMEKFVAGADEITVIYRVSGQDYQNGYETVKNRFKNVNFIIENNDFHDLVLKTLSSPYVAFLVDDMIIKAPIDLKECVAVMQKTKAYAFYLTHGKQLNFCYMQNCPQAIPPSVPLGNQIYAWKFKEGHADWKYPNSVDFVLYKKTEIIQDLEKIHFYNPNSFESEWAKRSKCKGMGLYYETSKCVNIPLNLVNPSPNRNMHSYTPQELLSLFTQGLKIDIGPLSLIENNSRHMEYTPVFCEREKIGHARGHGHGHEIRKEKKP